MRIWAKFAKSVADIGIGITAFIMLTCSIANSQEVMNRAEVEKIVREYLLTNPQIMLEVQEALQRQQQEQLSQQQTDVIAQNQDALFSSEGQLVFGDEDAKLTVVEFFDYNCSFCQRALADMQQIVEADQNVRFVLKEFPVLGEASVEASRVSLAFTKLMPEKAGQFHIDLLAMPGLKDGDRARELAVDMGVDLASLNAEMEKSHIIESISETYGLAEGLGITGTPSYVVGSKVIFGAVGYDQLKQEMASQLN
ncbi:MAG: DsbA family protein [Rhizobiaceae bacterium]|nr:DsbA family protein [Rhizobiaceae bacterium]